MENRELISIDVYDTPADLDGSHTSIYRGGEWLRNFTDYGEAVVWLEDRGYTIAYPEQEGDWSDPVHRLMMEPDTVAVYEKNAGELFERYELDAYLGDYAEDFDINAIIDEATYMDYRTGNLYWKPNIDLATICARYDKSTE